MHRSNNTDHAVNTDPNRAVLTAWSTHKKNDNQV